MVELDGSTFRVFIHIINKWRVYFNNSFDHLEPWQIVLYTLSWIFLIQWIRKIVKYEETLSLSSALKELIMNVPLIRKKHEESKESLQKAVDDKLLKYDTLREFYKFLPDRGLTTNDIVGEATDYRTMSDLLFERGRMSGSTFTESDEDHLSLLQSVFKIYCYTNAQFPDVYPACRKMEAEIIRMLCSLFHGGVKSCGAFTPSSAESILLACTAYRNKAYKTGIRKPEIIVSENVTIGFFEAAKTLGIRIIKVRLNKLFEADIGAIKRAISRETCLIVLSAPSPVFGTIDKIEDISQLALRYGVPLHVDAGYGGFLLPFMEQCDYRCPSFDFRVSGISSITVDLDKYGLCPVGSSAVLYRDSEMLEFQTFIDLEWSGGVYISPTISDNRSGMQIALTWATLLYHGRHGYVEKTQLILDSAHTLLQKLKEECDGIIHVIGEPTLSIITFTTTPSSKVPVHWLGDELNELGWNLTLQQNPDSYVALIFIIFNYLSF